MEHADGQPTQDHGAPLSEPEVSGVRVLRNTLVNGLASVAGVLVAIVLTPIMLDRLGQQRYGVWALALMLTISSGYLTLTDLGLQQSAVRFMADARRERDAGLLRQLYSTTLATLAGIAVLVGAVVFALCPFLVDLFSVPRSFHGAATLTFRLVGLQVLFDLPALAPRAVLESAQRFAYLRALDLSRAAGLALAIIGLLVAGVGLEGLGAASLLVAGLSALGAFALVRVTDPAARVSGADVSRAQLRHLMGFSSALFVMRVLSVMYRNVDKVILAIATTITVVAAYEVANKVSSALWLLFTVAGSAILPAATLVRMDRERLRSMYLRSTRHAVALLLPASVAVFLVARPLIITWVGAANIAAVPLVKLFALWMALGTFESMGPTILIALGRLRPIVILSTLWVVGNIGLSALLVGPLGAPGVIWGTIIAYVPLGLAFVTLCLRELNIAGREFLRIVATPIFPGLTIQVVVTVVALILLAHTPAFCQLLVPAGLGLAGAYGGYLTLGLKRDERAELLRAVRSALRPGRTLARA